MKKISLWTFIFSTLAVGFVMVSCIPASWAYDDGTLNSDSKWMFLVKLFHVLRFPAHDILGTLIYHPIIWLMGLAINCFLYGLLIERLISLFRKK
jgi:hypothetical protein